MKSATVVAMLKSREIPVPAPLTPERQRRFAVDVVAKLRAAGFYAYWAGGCVRDQLLRRVPKDYDVATDATPAQIRSLFSHRRTLAIGAAFGVITVVGPPGSGQVEVATFRRDADYSDGRHPDSVHFSTPQEDAHRRDFTINGLFYDPIEDQVIDYVGGQADLHEGTLRAIGNPYERFREDKLRMLRAVRFAAVFQLRLDPATAEAARQMASEIRVVSPERIAMEMQRILTDPHRGTGVRLLLETGLAAEILPEIVPAIPAEQRRLEETLVVLDRLEKPGFPLALAALVQFWMDGAATRGLGERWRLSNQQSERAAWLVENRDALRGGRGQRWSSIARLFVSPGIEDLVALHTAVADAGLADADDALWARSVLARPREEWDPPPLLTGDDLLRQGIPPGPRYRAILDGVRDAQLDGEIHTKAEALRRAERLAVELGG